MKVSETLLLYEDAAVEISWTCAQEFNESQCEVLDLSSVSAKGFHVFTSVRKIAIVRTCVRAN